VELDGYKGNTPGFPSTRYVFLKYEEGINSRLKPARPSSFSGIGLSRITVISTPLSLGVTLILESKS
jgi:hypothetical protein